MEESTKKRKGSNKFNLPVVDSIPKGEIKLPFNGNAVTEKSLSFSFACFDRSHKLFNLGDTISDGTVSGKWFLDLMDCLKSVSNKTYAELSRGIHDMHPVDWKKANANRPAGSEQIENWEQFRINKSRGRVIGFIINGVFYVMWLDPHHNFTDSEGYGTATYYRPGLSEYETLTQQLDQAYKENEQLKQDLAAAEELLPT